MTAPTDEEMDDDLDRRATELLYRMLGLEFVVHGPIEEIRDAMRRLSTPGAEWSAARTYFLTASDWAGDELEDVERLEPVELEDAWIGAAASIVAPYEFPDVEPLPADVLVHPDWLTIAVGLNRAGPGEVVDVAWLVELLEVDEATDPDARVEVVSALAVVCELWRALGVIDAQDRLTELGAWGVPVALLDAWESPDDEDG